MSKTLFGFTKPIYTKSNVIVRIKRLADNYIKTNTDETGVVSDPNVYQEAINLLLPYSEDLTVANKIANLKNSIEKLNSKIEKAEKDLVLFQSEHQTAIIDTVQDNYADPMNLFESLALYYGGALDKYDEKIIGGSLKELPSGVEIPQSVRNFRDELDRKSVELVNLSNSYFFEDPKTELVGPANPDAYGVFIQTNSQTGAILNIDVDMVDSIIGVRKGFKMTNSRYGRLPIYLNTFSSGEDKKGRIGNVEYEWDSGDDVLKLKKGVFSGFVSGLERVYRVFGGETLKGAKQEQQEVSLGGIPFDYFQIPSESVVVDTSGNYYWYGSDNNLWKAKDADTLKQYLTEINKDSKKVDEQAFIGHPNFVSAKFIPDENGNQRLIDDDTLGTFKIQRAVDTVIPPSGEKLSLPKWKEVPTTGTPALTPETPKYTEEKGYEAGKIIEEGRKIFKPITAPFEFIFKK